MERASAFIDNKVKELGDWRGKTLAKVRGIIHAADPEIVEEWKWAKATVSGFPGFKVPKFQGESPSDRDVHVLVASGESGAGSLGLFCGASRRHRFRRSPETNPQSQEGLVGALAFGRCVFTSNTADFCSSPRQGCSKSIHSDCRRLHP